MRAEEVTSGGFIGPYQAMKRVPPFMARPAGRIAAGGAPICEAEIGYGVATRPQVVQPPGRLLTAYTL